MSKELGLICRAQNVNESPRHEGIWTNVAQVKILEKACRQCSCVLSQDCLSLELDCISLCSPKLSRTRVHHLEEGLGSSLLRLEL